MWLQQALSRKFQNSRQVAKSLDPSTFDFSFQWHYRECEMELSNIFALIVQAVSREFSDIKVTN